MTKLALIRLAKKHVEFEAAAARIKNGRRSIAKGAGGIMQHVVESPSSILRWTISYENAAATPPKSKIRYVSLIPT